MANDILFVSTPENADCLLKNLDNQHVKVERAVFLLAVSLRAISLRSVKVEFVINVCSRVNQTFLDF